MFDSKFGAAEVIEMAKDIEKRGQEFYEIRAEKTDNQELKDLLLRLASDEKDHYQRFTELANQFELESKENSYVYNEEVSAYLNALVEFAVFPVEGRIDKQLEEMSVGDVLGIAIRAEKDSILFYQEMLEHNQGRTAGVIKKLIDEEKGHLLDLVRMDARLQ
ncbi:MAG: ferritin-like domain-containing protein [Bacillota bacterium]